MSDKKSIFTQAAECEILGNGGGSAHPCCFPVVCNYAQNDDDDDDGDVSTERLQRCMEWTTKWLNQVRSNLKSWPWVI